VSTTYTTDFNLWVQQTAQLLRERRWQEIDLEHLIEEVEDLGKSERRGISSQLTRLMLHLLKWQYQPQRRSDSWLDSITDARTQIELAIQDSPSLKSYPEGKVRQNWTTFSSPGFGIANFSFLAGKTSYLLITKLGLLTIKMLVLPRLSNFVQFHWTPAKQLEPSYQQARRKASKQTGIPLSVFPTKCPYSLELILDEDWLPGKDH
jgi:hypothetical protein